MNAGFDEHRTKRSADFDQGEFLAIHRAQFDDPSTFFRLHMVLLEEARILIYTPPQAPDRAAWRMARRPRS